MKTQFFTRNLCLGMLMTLVLAFSVQGTADAQRITETSGDHQNQSPNLPFNSPLVFTISDVTAADLPPLSAGQLGNPPSPPTISAVNPITITGSGVTINGVTISGKTTITTTMLNQPQVYSPAVTTTTHPDAAERTALSTGLNTYNNANTTLRVGSNTITVRLTAGSSANSSATVTVGLGNVTLKTFTFYVAANATPSSQFDPESPNTSGDYRNIIFTGRGDRDIVVATTAQADNVLVDFSIISGSGRLYFDPDDRSRAQNRATVGVDGTNASIKFISPSSGVTIIQVTLQGTNQRTSRTHFSNFANLTKVDDVSGRTGVIGTRLPDPFVVEVRDGETGTRVPNQTVQFEVSFSGTNLPHKAAAIGTTVATPTMLVSAADSTRTKASTAADTNPNITLDVQTDSRGRAAVYLTMGKNTDPAANTARTDVGIYTIKARLMDSAPQTWDTEIFTARSAAETAEAIIEIASGDNQRVDSVSGALDEQLVVRVLNRNRQIVQGEPVTFRATVGTVTGDPNRMSTGSSARGQFVTQDTDEFGQAAVAFVIGDTTGDAEVRAVINPATQHEQAVTFTILGRGGAPTPAPTPAPAPAPDPVIVEVPVLPPEPRIIVTPGSLSGGPGSSYKLTISARNADGIAVSVPRVALSNLAFTQAGGTVSPITVTAPVTATVTLPSTPGRYHLSAAATGYQEATVNITVAGGTIGVRVDPVSGGPGTSATITVTSTNSARSRARNVPVALAITPGGGTFSRSLVTTGPDGTATSTLTRGSTIGSDYFITATADGYTQSSVLAEGERVVIATAARETRGPTGTTSPAGDPARLSTYDGTQQTGSLNAPLPEPLIVEVVDANDNPVENVRVRFRTTIGSGQFSPRTPRTDEEGLAETTFTPTSAGRIRIVATVAGVTRTAAFNVEGGDPADALKKVSGDNQNGTPDSALADPFVVEVQDEDGEPLSGHTVSFSVTAGGGSLSETSDVSDADGHAETTLTLGSERGVNSVRASVPGADPVTFNTSIEPKILVAAANRPVMYWIDSGALYRLAGAKAEMIAESANGIAVGSSKVYWTSQTGASSGAINSANLDGSDVTELKAIRSVPMGIAVDAAGSKLYWTSSSGKIKRANLNGSSPENFMQNLSNPTDIVVSNGFIYWTEDGKSIRRVNTSGQKIARDVAANLDTVGGLAVGGGKVYWTEQTSASTGTVNGANLNGTNFGTLASTLSVPMGIAVDTAGSKVYWTSSSGKVKRANLDGSRGEKVVEGLISPSALAIGGANTETTATTTKKATTSAKKDNAAYDVNSDGTVDNTDASLVAAAMNTSNTKYDVNGDGTVNFLDLLLVFDNRDADAAGAPTIVGMKLSAVQIDVIEEQIDLLLATNDRSPARAADAGIPAATSRDGTSGENAVVCELSESVQPRNVDSV